MNYSDVSTLPLQQTKKNTATGKRILIVDDQETVLLFLKVRLEQLGFVVSLASNGKEGIGLLQENSFHGILLDLEMPVMDGYAMLSQVRKNTNNIPIIVMSANPTKTAMSTAIETGARDYLTKPISDVILKYKCLRLFS